MKYIDSEKLIAEIERRKNILSTESPFGIGGRVELELVLNTITSLQQEQPEVDLEKIEKASYKVFPVKKKLGAEIKYPNREDENFSKREIWKDGVIWAIYELWLNARKKE